MHSHCANQLNYSDDSLSVDITLLQNVNTDMLAGQIGFFFFSVTLKEEFLTQKLKVPPLAADRKAPLQGCLW